jgi:hypothetical protein
MERVKSLTLIAVVALAIPAMAQPNDPFSGRTTLTGATISDTGSNENATKEAGEPNHAGNPGGKSLWWSWTAPDSGNVTISTTGSSFDTLLAVYTGDSLGGLTLVAGNDDIATGNQQSAVTFAAVSNATYAVAVDGFNNNGTISAGTIQLGIALGGGGGGGGFPTAAATFVGLITGDEVTHENSGLATIATRPGGAYGAKVVLAGQRLSAAGRFAEDGTATGTLRGAGGDRDLALQIDEEGNTIQGTITDANGSTGFIAHRSVFGRSNPAPQAGTYTLLMPGGEDSTVAPAGSSIGTVTIRPTGQLKFSGLLADGTKVTHTTVLGPNGEWPLYIPLYGGAGSLVGNLTVDPAADKAVSGTVTWFKPAGARSKNYPNGFTLDTAAQGSVYQFTKGTPVLDLPSGQLLLQGATFPDGVTDDVTVSSRNQITSTTGNLNMRLKVSPKNGMIKGSISDPTTSRKIPVNAVVIQRAAYAEGFFLDSNESGLIFIRTPGGTP